MLLKLRDDNLMVKVADLTELVNPYQTEVSGCLQSGQEEQESRPFSKADLCFPSGEPLPRCWRDAHYRDREVGEMQETGSKSGAYPPAH